MLEEKLKSRYEYNEPIFMNEILEIMEEYSRSRIYQIISEEEKQEKIKRFDNGIYYLPKQTEFGISVPSVNDVIDKKYIKNKSETFGIYGRNILDYNFLISTQVPNVIEVITNKEARRVRKIEIRGHKVILRKSRFEINRKNEGAYTIMELFSNLNVSQYKSQAQIRNCVTDYIKENNIKIQDILEMAAVFPARTMKKLVETGVLYELA